ncbi:hypothetical protein [Nocardia sp. IFM 10818]
MDADERPVRERVRAVLRWVWVVLLGMYAVYFVYAGVAGSRSPDDDAWTRVLWVAGCLSFAVGFAASAVWIHRRGTARARPRSEGLRNALSWAVTWVLAYISLGFLLAVVFPRGDFPDTVDTATYWYYRLGLSTIYIAVALATGAAALWVRRKTRPRPVAEDRAPRPQPTTAPGFVDTVRSENARNSRTAE